MDMSSSFAPDPASPTEPIVLRARATDELIAVVPALLGFHPQHSLVAIAVHGPRHRLGLRLRLDLPPVEHATAVAREVTEHLRRQRPDGVLLVAFAEHPTDADAVVEATIEKIDLAGLGLLDAVRCDGRRYWSYLCPDDHCCPTDGTPYDARSNVLLAEAVFRGVEVLPDREAVARRYDPIDGEAAERVAVLTQRVLQTMATSGGGGPGRGRSAEFLQPGLDRVLAIVDDAASSRRWPLGDEDVATLSVWGSLIVVRDVLWARIGQRNASAQLELWRHVAQRAVPPFEPAMLCLAGFAAWLSGHGAEARCAIERALLADPDYSMAGLLHKALDEGLSPEAWEGMDVEAVLRTVPGLT